MIPSGVSHVPAFGPLRRSATALAVMAVILLLEVLAGSSPAAAAQNGRRPRLAGPSGAFVVSIDGGEVRAFSPEVDVELPTPPDGEDQVRLSNDGTQWSDAMPWAKHIAWNLIDPSTGGVDMSGIKTVSVQWRAGSAWEDVGSDDILYYNQDPIVGPFTLGDGSGISHQWVVDINGGSDSDPRGLVGFQWSLDGETWSRVFRYDEDRLRGWIDLRNMSLGGGWKLGTRTVWKKVLNDVGGSATRTASIELVDMDTRAEKVRFAFPRPAVTGELFTIKVIYPDGVRPPADFHCKWSLEWGSLQGGYDETYREVSMERPVTGNECDEWTFTLPWSPFLKYHWRFGIEHLETQADWSDTPDSWPETTTFRATEGTRELGIPRSSVRLAWLLPDKDVAALGESITYRMSTSRPIGGGDAWDPEGGYFSASPLLDWNDGYRQDGGRSFTYTPHLPGLWVTGWYWTPPGGWRDGLTRMQFDPIVDGVKPRVSARTAERREGAGSTRTTPYRLTWTARDPLTIPSPPKRVVSGTGIARFQIASRRNRGAWTVVKAVPADTRATSVRLAKGGRVDLRIRARDRAGNWSTWSAWPSVRP